MGVYGQLLPELRCDRACALGQAEQKGRKGGQGAQKPREPVLGGTERDEPGGWRRQNLPML